jgi:hypothetical protein
MSAFISSRQRHEWNEKPEKPWACTLCGFYTANLRHIENGFCRHEWGQRFDMTCCVRCGVVMNNRNAERPCIGTVKVELRRAPVEGGGVAYTDDKPLSEECHEEAQLAKEAEVMTRERLEELRVLHRQTLRPPYGEVIAALAKAADALPEALDEIERLWEENNDKRKDGEDNELVRRTDRTSQYGTRVGRMRFPSHPSR